VESMLNSAPNFVKNEVLSADTSGNNLSVDSSEEVPANANTLSHLGDVACEIAEPESDFLTGTAKEPSEDEPYDLYDWLDSQLPAWKEQSAKTTYLIIRRRDRQKAPHWLRTGRGRKRGVTSGLGDGKYAYMPTKWQSETRRANYSLPSTMW
jgi:hypothetical protein